MCVCVRQTDCLCVYVSVHVYVCVRQTDLQTYRQADRQRTDGQTDRQADTEREGEEEGETVNERESVYCVCVAVGIFAFVDILAARSSSPVLHSRRRRHMPASQTR